MNPVVLVGPALSPWTTDPAVAELQELLNAHGFSLRVDGDFGSRTEAAVKAYQHQRGLKVTGMVDAKTWIALKTTIQGGTRILQQGRTGADVYELQGLLQIHGYSVHRDGVFGDATHQVVLAFQRRHQLEEDGRVDAITWTVLRGGCPLPTPPKQRGWFLNTHKWW